MDERKETDEPYAVSLPFRHLLRSLLTLGSLPSPHVSDGNGTEGGVDGTEVRWR